MSGSRRSTTQQSNGCPSQHVERLGAGADRRDLDVVVQPAARRCSGARCRCPRRRAAASCAARRRILIRSNACSRSSVVRRLDEVRERAVRQAVLPLLLDREHLHRDVARRRIELQVVEHRPAEHVGQEDVERDGGRQVLARQRQRRLAAVGDDALEALVAREAEQDARVVRVVVDDEQDVVASLDVVAVVGDGLFGFRHRQHRQRDRRGSLVASRSASPGQSSPAPAGVGRAAGRA